MGGRLASRWGRFVKTRPPATWRQKVPETRKWHFLAYNLARCQVEEAEKMDGGTVAAALHGGGYFGRFGIPTKMRESAISEKSQIGQPSPLLTSWDVARILKISRPKVYDIKAKIGFCRIDGAIRYRQEDVTNYIASCREGHTKPFSATVPLRHLECPA